MGWQLTRSNGCSWRLADSPSAFLKTHLSKPGSESQLSVNGTQAMQLQKEEVSGLLELPFMPSMSNVHSVETSHVKPSQSNSNEQNRTWGTGWGFQTPPCCLSVSCQPYLENSSKFWHFVRSLLLWVWFESLIIRVVKWARAETWFTHHVFN